MTHKHASVHRDKSGCCTQVLADQGKARVVFVADQGPAQRAGLSVGDTVLSLNEQPVSLNSKLCVAALRDLLLLLVQAAELRCLAAGSWQCRCALRLTLAFSGQAQARQCNRCT